MGGSIDLGTQIGSNTNGSVDLGMQVSSNLEKAQDVFENLLETLSTFVDYILGFFSYLVESAQGLLNNGNILFFVLFTLIIWKIVMKLKG